MRHKSIIRMMTGMMFLLWASSLATASVPAKWETTGLMTTARSNHAAIYLANGTDSQILIVGGIGSGGPLASAELYDVNSGMFSSTTGPMGAARAYHTITYLYEKALIVGGLGTGGPLASGELYDMNSKTFIFTTGPMGTARADHTATFVYGPAVLIAGGNGTSGILASAELYDTNAGTFSLTGSMNAARAYHTATTVSGGKVLITGGTGPSGPLVSAELYDPVAKTFSFTTGSMNAARAYHTATVVPDGKVLIVGGIGPGGALSSAELYDPLAGTFSLTTGSMQTARAYHTATVMPDGKVLIAGGSGSGGPLDSAEVYDPQTETFSPTLPMASAREQHTATLTLNGKVLIAGGIGPSNQLLDSAELYSPALYYNWELVGTPLDANITTIRIDPENENLWYVGGGESGIYITSDSGNTWMQRLNGGYVRAIEIDPNNHSVVYAGSGLVLYKSVDHGVTWTIVNSFPGTVEPPPIVERILVSSVNGSIYVGITSNFDGYVYKSSDGGTTWNILSSFTQGVHIWDLEEDPLNGFLYYCTEYINHSVNASLMRSEDFGASWTDIIPWQNPFGHGLSIQVRPGTHDVYFLTETTRILWKSSDYGDNWTGTNVTMNADLIIDKNYTNRFFGRAGVGAGIGGAGIGGVYVSEETGQSFIFTGLAGKNLSSLALTGMSTKLFAAAYDGQIYVADWSIPIVTSTSPANNAANVPVNSLISATFSESMDAGTINAATFTLSGGITGTVAYDPGTNTATLTPLHNLAVATTYTATIMTGVTDLGGNPLTSNYTWSFTTTAGLPDLTGKWTQFFSWLNRRAIIGVLRVSNIGVQNAKGFSVAFYLSVDGRTLGRLIQTNTVSGLRAGSYVDIGLGSLFFRSQLDRYVIAVIDPDNRIVESNEKNNSISHLIQ